MKRTLGMAIVVLVLVAGHAQAAGSPVGRWKTFDDETKQATSIVEIYGEGGAFNGRIVELLGEPDGGRAKLCDRCTGAERNRPLVGLVVLRGLTRDGTTFSGGTITDPKTGKTYKCTIELLDGGARLKVRGFVGLSLAGRNQFWQRVS